MARGLLCIRWTANSSAARHWDTWFCSGVLENIGEAQGLADFFFLCLLNFRLTLVWQVMGCNSGRFQRMAERKSCGAPFKPRKNARAKKRYVKIRYSVRPLVVVGTILKDIKMNYKQHQYVSAKCSRALYMMHKKSPTALIFGT